LCNSIDAAARASGAKVPKRSRMSWQAGIELGRSISESVPRRRLGKPSRCSGGRQGCGSGDEGLEIS
jgi:hypothetical protein